MTFPRRFTGAVLLVAFGLLHGAFSADSPKPGGKERPPFRVPAGLVVERVAGPPLVEHPVMAGFDNRGRLFVAESAGRNLRAPELLKELPNSIRLLEDSNGDGVFDKATVFADKMTFPMGVLWHDGAVYSCSPPSVWRLEDTTGKGVADKRREIVTKFGFSGNAADIHGPFAGPDGRLYWTDGRHGHEIKRAQGGLMKGHAARIFRCRPDGSEVEAICGGGMDDPVEIAFTAEGEPIATVDIFQARPRRVDALIHCIEGGVFPYHEVVKEFRRTGPLLPAVSDLGWVAPSGLMRYRGAALGADYRGNLFSAQFNTHKIQRHVLTREGASFRASNEDFLVLDNPAFHPTDVLEDADGSLLVIDTGGWFRIGCPTSQVARPEEKGAIYRVRRKGAPKVADPWGLQLGWDKLTAKDLTALLDDPRWPVRDRAVEQLGKRGGAAVPALSEALAAGQSVSRRRNAVWALTRIETAEARAGVRIALKDADASVRNCAAHSAGLHRDTAAQGKLMELVAQDTPAVRREAATGLGRLRQAAAVPALLDGLRKDADRFLEHALIYALIQIADRKATLQGLRDPNPQVRRGALIALDQMPDGNLTRELVMPLLNTPDPNLQQTALAVVTAHPDWARQMVDFLRQWLGAAELPQDRREILRGALLAFCKDTAVQELAARSLDEAKTPAAIQQLLLETMAEAPLDPLPARWRLPLGRALESRTETVARQAVATVRARGVTDFDAVLVRLARDKDRPADLRVAALAAATPRSKEIEPGLFAFLLQRLDPNLPPLARLAAADAVGHARLTDAQLASLAQVLAGSGALELPHLVAPFERSKDGGLGRQLVAALNKSPGLTSLSADALRRTLRGYPTEVRQAAATLFQRLEVDAAKMKARLDQLAPVLAGGDGRRGRDVFFGKKAACSACHTVGAQGGQVGPDLSKIGGIRAGRDLLEAIVFPSASFVRGYEPYVVATKEGRLHTGILKRQTAEAIYLVTTERAEFRLPKSTVDTFEPGRVSIMPQGLEAQMSRQELADLIAFLQGLK